eukprot:2579932-Rhodomonas_salina.3
MGSSSLLPGGTHRRHPTQPMPVFSIACTGVSTISRLSLARRRDLERSRDGSQLFGNEHPAPQSEIAAGVSLATGTVTRILHLPHQQVCRVDPE